MSRACPMRKNTLLDGFIFSFIYCHIVLPLSASLEIPQYLHVGEIIDGIDMRAEVGLLTRNIVIQGETEDSCYADNHCQFFDYDTFGGHVMVGKRI